MQRLLFLIVAAAGVAALACWPVGTEAHAPPSERKETPAELINQLGSADAQTREEAIRRLLARRDALPALEEAMRSNDAAVRQRVAPVLEEARARLAKAAVRRAVRLGKGGEADQLVEHLVFLGEKGDADCWRAAVGLADALAKAASKEANQEFRLPDPDIVESPLLSTPALKEDLIKIHDHRIVTETADVQNSVGSAFLVSRGATTVPKMVSHSIIFSNGDLKVGTFIARSIIFCDGDVEVGTFVDKSVVVATGSVKVAGWVTKDCVVKEKEANPLGLKTFQPSQLGAEVAESDKGPRVTKVEADTPLGKAGLQRGDEVLELDGQPTKTPGDFRKCLRRAAAEKPYVPLKVNRDGKTTELTLWLPE
jgi:PDZ domain